MYCISAFYQPLQNRLLQIEWKWFQLFDREFFVVRPACRWLKYLTSVDCCFTKKQLSGKYYSFLPCWCLAAWTVEKETAKNSSKRKFQSIRATKFVPANLACVAGVRRGGKREKRAREARENCVTAGDPFLLPRLFYLLTMFLHFYGLPRRLAE